MPRNIIRESTEAATRLVAVKAVGRVFAVRRFGVVQVLRAQGIAVSLGAVGAQLAVAEKQKRETEKQIDENVDLVRSQAGDDAAEHERKQLEAMTAATSRLTEEEQIELFADKMFPLVAACVVRIGELRPDVDVDGVLPSSTKPEDVCSDLALPGEPQTFMLPVRLVLDDEADVAKGELAVWTLGAYAVPFGGQVLEAATDFRSVSLPRPNTGAAADRPQVGKGVRTPTLGTALRPGSPAGGSRSRGAVRGGGK